MTNNCRHVNARMAAELEGAGPYEEGGRAPEITTNNYATVRLLGWRLVSAGTHNN